MRALDIPLFQFRRAQLIHDTPIVVVPSYLDKLAVGMSQDWVGTLRLGRVQGDIFTCCMRWDSNARQDVVSRWVKLLQ